jgi:putative colanic acid biosysnthesis UDP-glucose lipid carrier transferase
MPLRYSRYIPFISITGDFIILNALFVLGYALLVEGPEHFEPHYLLFYLYLNVSWFILVFVFGAHDITRNTRKKSIFFAYIKIIVFFFFLFLMYFQATPMDYYPRSYIKYLFPLFFFLLISWKFLLYYAFLYYRKRGYNYRTVIILGYTAKTRDLYHYFTSNRWHGYRFLGFFDEHKSAKKRIIGEWDELKQYIENNHVDEIYIAWDGIPNEVMPRITEIISDYPVKVRIVPDLGNFSYKSAELISYGPIPVLQIHPGPLSYWYNRLIKRIFDVLLSLVFIIGIISWFTPLLYLLSLLGSRGGVFFTQRRTCSDGREFICLKYRTMLKNNEADTKKATKNDNRVTPVGRFLRKFSLDELPQFINVLKGEMSVVGPRPHMLKHTDQYRKIIKRFMLRHTVKPGITGMAQVNGYRGEIRRLSELKKRVEYDVNYIEGWSFNLDLKIILLTTWVIFRGQAKAY